MVEILLRICRESAHSRTQCDTNTMQFTLCEETVQFRSCALCKVKQKNTCPAFPDARNHRKPCFYVYACSRKQHIFLHCRNSYPSLRMRRKYFLSRVAGAFGEDPHVGNECAVLKESERNRERERETERDTETLIA